jgi:hypothetical protein
MRGSKDPNAGGEPRVVSDFGFGSFVLVWDLVFGAWCFEFAHGLPELLDTRTDSGVTDSLG